MKAVLAALVCLLTVSCGVVPKNYPRNQPFVYDTNIEIDADLKGTEKTDLVGRLRNQLDDSIRVKTVPQLYREVLRNPPVYDSLNAEKSIGYMGALMTAMGYFRDSIWYDTTMNVVRDQYRTTVNFNVRPGKVTRLDSIKYHIGHDHLQHLTDSTMAQRFLKTGDPFAQSTISAELDRLTTLYRNRGYLRFTRDELIGLWDTLDVALLRPTLDPFEQLEQLQRLQERRNNPTANLEIRLKPGYDSAKLVKYYVGNINIYPDYSEDTLSFTRKEKVIDSNFKIIYYRNLFKPKIFPESIFMRRGIVYNQARYVKTINRFNSLGSWRLVNIEQIPRRNSDTVDFNVRLTPADKFSFSANLEGSRNSNNLFSEGNLLGVGVNVGVQNRNLWKAANQATTNFRYGTELNVASSQQFIQTRQISLSNSILFPRAIPRLNFLPQRYRDNFRTLFSLNLANTLRKDYFNITTVNVAWGYETQWQNKLLRIKIPNIEYSFLDTLSKLSDLIQNNPSLKSVFTDGLVTSMVGNFTITGGKKNAVNIFRANSELSGLFSGTIRNKFIDSNIYRFLKVDADFSRNIQVHRKTFAFRLFAGVGYEFKSGNEDHSLYLPFFKSYFAGGPNSMRAWGLRRLGPGSAVASYSDIPDRFGDIQLEASAEFRFPLFTIAGVGFNSALFTDVGNVWYLRENPDFPGGNFKFSKFLNDLAVGVGTGLRVDFDFFLIRLDYGFKVRNPSPDIRDIESQNKWFYGWSLRTLVTGQLQLGINYPF